MSGTDKGEGHSLFSPWLGQFNTRGQRLKVRGDRFKGDLRRDKFVRNEGSRYMEHAVRGTVNVDTFTMFKSHLDRKVGRKR